MHTPGPWEAKTTVGAGWSVRRQYERPGYTGLAPICSMAWWQFDIPGIIDDKISEANARLVAAAPDYYEAALAMVKRHDERAVAANFQSCGCDDCAPFRAAIAKAEGVKE